MARDPKRVGDLVTELFAKGVIPGKQSFRDLQEAWNEATGSRLAEKTHVSSYRDGILIIGVTSSSLLFELNSFHKKPLEKALVANGTLGGFKALKFRADRV